MVSGLKYFRADPQNKGRGRGYYYYRGALMQPNGRRVKTYSKYSERRDAKLPHLKEFSENPNKKEKNQPHKYDYKTNTVKRNSKVPKVYVKSTSARKTGFVQKKSTHRRKGTKGKLGYF